MKGGTGEDEDAVLDGVRFEDLGPKMEVADAVAAIATHETLEALLEPTPALNHTVQASGQPSGDTPALDDFAELESWLEESQNAKLLATKMKVERKRLTDGTGMTPAEREQLRATILRWETDYEWNPKEMVAWFEGQLCSCGATHRHLVGLYQYQEHRHDASMTRLVLWSPQILAGREVNLPRSIHTTMKEITICANCADSQNFEKTFAGRIVQ